jgi:hypothetical protein
LFGSFPKRDVFIADRRSETLLASGVEHWVEDAGLKLYVWEKYLGSPLASRSSS